MKSIRSLAIILFLSLSCPGIAQPGIRSALFLGNSYTYVNSLPVIIAQLAHATGDSLFWDYNTPGGYTLGWDPIAHCRDAVSLAKIKSQPWDFVVLQEQSQTPAIPRLRDSCMFPASVILHDSVKNNNFCSRPLFYLTWGRRFGGVQCFEPNYCSTNFADYFQMQDSVTVAYRMIANYLNDPVAPAGEAWRHILATTGMVLHASDDSHPNLNGSYLTACVFYDCIFHKPSQGNPFTAGLMTDSALILQKAADSVVFTDPSMWNLWLNLPVASFQTAVSGDTLFTHNLSTNSTQWLWKFGDGQTSTLFEPVHVYSLPGLYQLQLRSCDDCNCDSVSRFVTILPTGVEQPATGHVTLTGPDAAGIIRIKGLAKQGTLSLYDLSGRLLDQLPVIRGQARETCKIPSVFLWHLSDDAGRKVDSGKGYRN